jgi:5-methyltetrahydropteroyltriglutamate--homocysteine methyltransferase
MQRSTDRILTTHVGSLIRPKELLEYILPMQRDEQVDHTAFERALKGSVKDVVKRQEQAGVDVVSDGEFGKVYSWSQYVLDRMSGFEKKYLEPGATLAFARGSEDRRRFKEFYAEMDGAERRGRIDRGFDVVCTGPVAYTGQVQLQQDIDNFKAALAAANVTEGFLPVAAPASVIPDRENRYYKTEEELAFAIADAMRVEYKAIIDAGLIVQIDDARAAVTYDRMVPPASFDEFHKWLGMYMEALNYAIKGLPEDRIRYHVCWGSWPGPHTNDVPMKKIADLVLSVNCGAYVLEMANPRHEHEWKVWEEFSLPNDRILVPGVVSHATNIVEHPELVSERIVRLAELVGRENVIAGTDCGFAQSPAIGRVHPTIQWAKLEAIAEGARLASKTLWSRGRKGGSRMKNPIARAVAAITDVIAPKTTAKKAAKKAKAAKAVKKAVAKKSPRRKKVPAKSKVQRSRKSVAVTKKAVRKAPRRRRR